MAAIGKELGPPVDIDRYMGKSPNKIYRIGIELEGGWTRLPGGTNRLQHDGSVAIPQDGPLPLHLGELAIGPVTMLEWPKWVEANYPQKVNASCGMHVHLSPKTSLSYSRLMDPSYPGTVVAYVGRWAKAQGLAKDHPIWPRLKGKSIYCQHLYMAEDQIRNTGKDHNRERQGHRYTVINYCYGRYSTVECRLLPMMDNVEDAKSLIQEYIDITNAFLRATRKKEFRHHVSAVVEDEGSSGSMVVEIPPNPRARRIRV